MTPAESKLSAAERRQLGAKAAAALAVMRKSAREIAEGLAPITAAEAESFQRGDEPPAALTIRLLRNYLDVRRAQAGGQPIDDEELAYTLGYLYADAIAKSLAWDLVFLKTTHMQNGDVAAVSPDRKYAAYPAMFIYRLLMQPDHDNTIALSVNMLRENAMPDAPAKSYTIVIG